MGSKYHTPAVALLAASTVLIAGCGSSSSTSAPSVLSSGTGSSRTSIPSSASSPSAASGSPGSTGSTSGTQSSSGGSAAGGSRFTKGQKLGSHQLEQGIKAAIFKAGGTYAATTTSSTVSSTGHVRLIGDRTEGIFEEAVGGKEVTVIVLGGNAYVKGLGLGSKPWLKVTPSSTGAFAQALKPLLTITQGAPLSDSVRWTVTQTSPSGTTVSASPASGTTVTDQLDGKGLPISTVVSSAAGTKTDKYFDYGKPVRVSAPPASQVSDIPGGAAA